MEANCVRHGVTKLNGGAAPFDPEDLLSTPLRVGDSPLCASRTAQDQLVPGTDAVASSCGEGEGAAGTMATPSLLDERFPENLHELSGLLSAIVMNAQVLQWKLPPYSHLKRPLREMERKAQRGGALLNGLIRSCGGPVIERQADMAASSAQPKSATGGSGRSLATQAPHNPEDYLSSQWHVTPALAGVSQKGMIGVGTGKAAGESSGNVSPKGA